MFTRLKVLIPVIAASLMIASCGGPKNVVTGERKDVKGNWTLNNITYEGIPAGQNVRITLLDEGTDACLRGSTWKFPNNGNGTYTINSSAPGCMVGERSIVWSTRQEATSTIFQFKRISGGVKPKNVEEGYRFRIISADDNAMQLQSEVTFEGRPLYINYLFTKL
ncbi:MAG: lipocalin family protein [Chitinophagaceae bacterium]